MRAVLRYVFCSGNTCFRTETGKLVPGEGLEPSRLSAADFESAASTDSATPAGGGRIIPEAQRRSKRRPIVFLYRARS
jgi:hypothetical protein